MSDKMVAFGKFRIDQQAYARGKWLVYDAVELALERPVRLRLYNGQLPKQSDAEQTFIRRIRNVANLDHANVVSILDFGIVMERGYYTTPPRETAALGFLFAERKLDLLDEEERLQAGIDLFHALAHLHEAGMVHGCLGNDTIFWDQKRSFPFISWFPVLEEPADEFGITPAPVPRGFEGKQADVYRLGRVVHQLVTGTAPLGIEEAPGQTMAVNVPGATEGIYDVLEQVLRKDPQEAIPDAEGVVKELDRVLSKQKVRSELEKSVSSFQVPQEVLEKALEKKKQQKRRKRQTEGVSAAEMPYVSPLEMIPGGPKVAGIGALFALMLVAAPFLMPGSDGATTSQAPPPPRRPRPETLPTERPPQRPGRPTKPPTKRATKVSGGIEALQGAAPTDADSFLPRWGTLKSWILSLPPAKRRNLFTYGNLVQLRTEFKRDESSACRKLDDLIRQATDEL